MKTLNFRRPGDAYLKVSDVPPVLREKLKKNDLSEYLNMKHPNNKISVTASVFRVSSSLYLKVVVFYTKLLYTFPKGEQNAEKTPEKRMGRVHFGNLELSGDSLNNYRYQQTKTSDKTRFLTDNATR